MNNILMIAAEYPPCLSAGVQRTYHFAENLFRHGWQPHILSANERIYRATDSNVKVTPDIASRLRRAFAIDVTRHLSIKGKYIGWLENPDRFASWYFLGWRLGVQMVRDNNIDLIWSTYPISSAHWIANKVKKECGLPWVADYRDPMHTHVEPSAHITNKAKQIDCDTVENADAIVFATDKMKSLYMSAYPHVAPGKFHVIENGYDEKIFSSLKRTKSKTQRFNLLYSGALYPRGRDPLPLFEALSELKRANLISNRSFVLTFRGAGDGFSYQQQLAKLDILDMVEFKAPISFANSIQEMQNADGLLVLQGDVFNNQIPGKVYEYIATQNPILALVGLDGATSRLLAQRASAFVAHESDVQVIKGQIQKMLSYEGGGMEDVSIFSREYRSKQLLALLGQVMA